MREIMERKKVTNYKRKLQDKVHSLSWFFVEFTYEGVPPSSTMSMLLHRKRQHITYTEDVCMRKSFGHVKHLTKEEHIMDSESPNWAFFKWASHKFEGACISIIHTLLISYYLQYYPSFQEEVGNLDFIARGEKQKNKRDLK